MTDIQSITVDRWRVDFDERGVATLYRYGEKAERGITNDSIAFARALIDAQARIREVEIERDEARTALASIERRATPHPNDTADDSARQLRHILAIAVAARKEPT